MTGHARPRTPNAAGSTFRACPPHGSSTTARIRPAQINKFKQWHVSVRLTDPISQGWPCEIGSVRRTETCHCLNLLICAGRMRAVVELPCGGQALKVEPAAFG